MKLLHTDGDSDCVSSKENKSLSEDSDNESCDFTEHNTKINEKKIIFYFERKEEFKNDVTTQ